MPAIQPARLKRQVTDLVALYDQPVVFVRQLHALLDLYSDYTQRLGQAGIPSPLMASYNTPPPVMRQVWHELSKITRSHPNAALHLGDALWAEANVDLQLLAARLLGQLPLQPPEPVIERLQTWVHSDPDRRFLDGLLKYGLIRFLTDAPGLLLDLISSWLSSNDLQSQHAGLRALLPLSSDPTSPHLPVIFRLITPYTRNAPSRLRPDIVAVLVSLAHCSPSETAYLLRQNLATPGNPDTPWLIRHVLNEFPAETQTGLHAAMKSTSK
jgi:hypothetical protein